MYLLPTWLAINSISNVSTVATVSENTWECSIQAYILFVYPPQHRYHLSNALMDSVAVLPCFISLPCLQQVVTTLKTASLAYNVTQSPSNLSAIVARKANSLFFLYFRAPITAYATTLHYVSSLHNLREVLENVSELAMIPFTFVSKKKALVSTECEPVGVIVDFTTYNCFFCSYPGSPVGSFHVKWKEKKWDLIFQASL